MRGISLVVRGLWWRRGLTGALLVVAVATTASAALGPIYARAAGESILQDHLKDAGSRAGLHFQSLLDIGTGALTRVQQELPRLRSIPGYDTRVDSLFTYLGDGALAKGSQVAVNTNLAWRADACLHLVLVSGRCPAAPNEAIVSERTVGSRSYGFRLGSDVSITPLAPRGDFPSPAPANIHVVGVYRPVDTSDPYWFDQPYFDARVGANTPDTIDTMFVDRSEFESFVESTIVQAGFDYPLQPSTIRLKRVGTERSAVAHLLAKFNSKSPVTASSDLPAVLNAAEKERHLAEVGTLLVTLQLTLLAWLVLFQVMSDAIAARGNEVAMAKLRGLSPTATTRFGLGEPTVLLVLSVPLGVFAAFGVTRLFAASVLVRNVPVTVPTSALLTAAVAFAGGLAAAALAGYRTLTRSVLDQWRRTSHTPGGGKLALVVDGILTVAAVGGLVALRASHRSTGTSNNNTAALLAPGLLVAAVGLLGVRLLPVLSRWLARGTRASRQVAIFLASRQVARRPVGLRLASLLAVAVGLATFAVAGETVATANRSARAQTEVAASQVATVEFNSSTDPVSATERVDPSGTWAMAAATWLPDGGDSVVGTVLGVDSRRLAAVGFPSAGGPSLSHLAKVVGSAPVPPMTITATQVRVHLTTADLMADRPPYLEINLRTPRTRFYNVDSGAIANGSQSFTLPVSCSSGCTLLGLTWNRPINAVTPASGAITLTGIDVGDGATWKPLDLRTKTPGSWRGAIPEGQATDQVHLTDSGVADRFTNQNGGYGGVTYGFVPSPLPALANPKAIATGPSRPAQLQLLDSTQTAAYLDVKKYLAVLPSVLDDGVVMDVRYLLVELPGFATEANWQVWLGSKAPADAVALLTKAGLHVEHVSTERSRLTELNRQGPALALLLLLVCALAGTVLAVGGTAISINASSRRRSYEIAALRAVGVTRRSLLRASIVEQLMLLSAAAILGIPTGFLAARLAMPVIPQFADSTPVALHYTPHWIPTLLFAGAFVVLLSLTAIIAAVALLRVAVPSRLRETEG